MSYDGEVSKGLIACGYIVTLLIPFGGFIAGLILLLKGAKGHGIACLVIAVATLLVSMMMFGG